MSKTMSEALSVKKPTADIYEKLAGLASAGEVKRMLDGNGLVVVPREPTDEMIEIMVPLGRERKAYIERFTTTDVDLARFDNANKILVEHFLTSYKAMIKASQGE